MLSGLTHGRDCGGAGAVWSAARTDRVLLGAEGWRRPAPTSSRRNSPPSPTGASGPGVAVRDQAGWVPGASCRCTRAPPPCAPATDTTGPRASARSPRTVRPCQSRVPCSTARSWSSATNGVSSFAQLKEALRPAQRRARCCSSPSTCLHLDGEDLRAAAARASARNGSRRCSAGLPPDSRLRFGEHLIADGPAILAPCLPTGCRGHHRQAGRRALPLRPWRRLAQGEVPDAAGVRGRRLRAAAGQGLRARLAAAGGPRGRASWSTSAASARAGTLRRQRRCAPGWTPCVPSGRPSRACRRQRAAACAGCSPSSWPRCGSSPGPRTASCATRASRACARTRTRTAWSCGERPAPARRPPAELELLRRADQQRRARRCSTGRR